MSNQQRIDLRRLSKCKNTGVMRRIIAHQNILENTLPHQEKEQ